MGGEYSAYGQKMGRAGFWSRNLRETNHWGDPGVDGRIILKVDLQEVDCWVRTGSSWLRIWTGGGHL